MNTLYTCSYCDEPLREVPKNIHTSKDGAGKLEQRMTCEGCLEIIARHNKIVASTAGRVKTKKKAKSSRKNGKLGGRPKKKAVFE